MTVVNYHFVNIPMQYRAYRSHGSCSSSALRRTLGTEPGGRVMIAQDEGRHDRIPGLRAQKPSEFLGDGISSAEVRCVVPAALTAFLAFYPALRCASWWAVITRPPGSCLRGSWHCSNSHCFLSRRTGNPQRIPALRLRHQPSPRTLF